LSSTAERISSLTKNPPSGGIPLIEKTIKAKIIARIGFAYLRDEK
jgi:hypothetical protein